MSTIRMRVVLFVIFVLLVALVYLGFRYRTLQEELQLLRATLETRVVNEQVIGFSQLFINKVLGQDGEVSFEDRLKLENAVRDLKDEDILGAWTGFLVSKTEDQAQAQVKILLGLLVNKIRM